MTETIATPTAAPAAAPQTHIDEVFRIARLSEPERSHKMVGWLNVAADEGRLLQGLELASAVWRSVHEWTNPQTGEREVPLALLHITDGGLPATMAVVRRGGHIVFCVEPLDGRTYSWYELTRAQCDELHDVLGYDKAPFR